MEAPFCLEDPAFSRLEKSLYVSDPNLVLVILTISRISPLENTEVFWRSPSSVSGTPVSPFTIIYYYDVC